MNEKNNEVKTSIETESSDSGNKTKSETVTSIERDRDPAANDLSDGVKDSQVNVSIDQHFAGNNPVDTSHKNVEAAQPITDPLV